MPSLLRQPARPATGRPSRTGQRQIPRPLRAVTSEARASTRAEAAPTTAPPPPPPPTAALTQPPTAEAAPEAAAPATVTLTLTSVAARSGLRLAEIWDGTAPAIVVSAVADELASAGIAPGARLVSLPHPTRRGERWALTPGNAPISRVRDLIRVARSVTLDMEFSVDPIPAEAIAAWVDAQEKAAAEQEAAGYAEEGEEGEGSGGEGGGEDGRPAASVAPVIPDVATTPSSYLPSPEAVAYEEEARRQAVRLATRAERNAVEDARDDTPLLVGATVAFLGPAAAILAWAYATGLLDSLATHQY